MCLVSSYEDIRNVGKEPHKQSALRSPGSNPGNHITKDIKLQIKNNKILIPSKTSCL